MRDINYSFSSPLEVGNNEITIKYDHATGTENIFVDDELLTTTAITEERANSIFLEQSYIHTTISVDTYHRDNLNINDVVELDSVNYIVIGIDDTIVGAVAQIGLVLKRWTNE